MNQPARARVSRLILPAVLMALCVAVPVPVTANQDRASATMPPLAPPAAGSVAAVASPRVSVPDYVVGEADGTVDIVVSLDAVGLNTVTVPYQTETATADGNDFVGLAGLSLVFSPGDTVKHIVVTIKNDLIAEGIQSFTLHLLGATGGTLAKAVGRVSIIDDDTLVVSPHLLVRDATVDEKAGTVAIPVLLGGPIGEASASSLSVDYTTTAGSATPGPTTRPPAGPSSSPPATRSGPSSSRSSTTPSPRAPRRSA